MLGQLIWWGIGVPLLCGVACCGVVVLAALGAWVAAPFALLAEGARKLGRVKLW